MRRQVLSMFAIGTAFLGALNLRPDPWNLYNNISIMMVAPNSDQTTRATQARPPRPPRSPRPDHPDRSPRTSPFNPDHPDHPDHTRAPSGDMPMAMCAGARIWRAAAVVFLCVCFMAPALRPFAGRWRAHLRECAGARRA